MDISQKIKDLRKSKNLSQRDLAEILETTQSAVNYFENKGKDLTLGQTERLANALGVSVKELLFDEKEEKTDNNAFVELQRQIDFLTMELKYYKEKEENEKLREENAQMLKEMEETLKNIALKYKDTFAGAIVGTTLDFEKMGNIIEDNSDFTNEIEKALQDLALKYPNQKKK